MIGSSQRYGSSCSLWHQDSGTKAAQDGSMDPSAWAALLPTQLPLLLLLLPGTIYRTGTTASLRRELIAHCLVLPRILQAPGGCSKRKDGEGLPDLSDNIPREQTPGTEPCLGSRVLTERQRLARPFPSIPEGRFGVSMLPSVVDPGAGPEEDRQRAQTQGYQVGVSTLFLHSLCGLREIAQPF